MAQKFSNGARSRLVSSITNSATSFTIESATADLMPVANTSNWGTPADWFKAVLQNDLGQIEIIHVGVRGLGSGVLSNVLRGRDGTAALAFAAGSVIGLRLTAADVESALGASLNAVQRSGNETIAGTKTFSSPIVGSITGNAATADHADTADAAVTAGTATAADYATTAGSPFAQTLLDDTTPAQARETLGTNNLPVTETTGMTLTAAHRGGLVSSIGVVVVPSGVFSAGDVVSIYNNSNGSIGINGAALTLRQAGTANTGTRTLLQRGVATVLFISPTEAVISGSGLA